MVLQDDRTSVPLPPNLYLLNQNQKFMKRTLHLTVMMLLVLIASVNRAYGQEERVVLLDYNFENGLDGWSYGSEWYYYSNKKEVKGYARAIGPFTRKLYKTIQTNGIYYKDIEVTCEMTGSTDGAGADYYAFVEMGKSCVDKIHENDGPTRPGTPVSNFRVGFAVASSSTVNQKYTSATCYPRTIKVTGVPIGTIDQPEYTITDMRDFKNLPDNVTVKVEFEDATVLTRFNGTVILSTFDKGGIVINDSTGKGDIVVTDEGIMGMPYVVSGSVTGIHAKKNGWSELFCPKYDAVISENQQIQWYGTEIKYEDYYDHIGEYVAIPSLSDIDMWDKLEWSYNYQTQSYGYTVSSMNSNYYKVSGIVFPYKNGEGNLRLIINNNSPGYYYGFNQDSYNDYEQFYGQNMNVYRHMEKGKWYTLCLPFDIKTINHPGTYAMFDGGYDGVLSFNIVSLESIPAGTPFMYKPTNDKTYPLSGTSNVDNGNPVYDSKGDYSFVGLLNPGEAESGSCYLAAGNTIKPFIPGSMMKAFHAYFVPNTPTTARARAINIDGETTAIEDVEWGDGNPFLAPTDNRIYNLEGQMVGNDLNQLPKGLYIVNGKKVIK